VAALAAADPGGDILAAWIAKELVRDVLACAATGGMRYDIAAALYRFYAFCAATKVPEIHDLAQTIETWQQPMLLARNKENTVTDVMIDEKAAEMPERAVVRLEDLDEQLIGQLVDRARGEGLRLTGEDGLLGQLTKRIIEAPAKGEMDEHLSYAKHDPAGRDGANSRNGVRAKTVLTDIGPVEVAMPRDRGGTFEPQIVRRRQRRLSGIDGLVISLSARGLTQPADVEPGIDAVKLAQNRIDAFAKRWRDSYPAAVRCLLDDRGSLTVYLRFPREHWTRVRHSNFIERTFGETRRRVKVIGRLPGEHSCLKLVWAVLDRASAGWRGFTMTPAGLRLLQDLRRALHDPPAQLPQRFSENRATTGVAAATEPVGASA